METALSRWDHFSGSITYAEMRDLFKNRLAQVESQGRGETDPHKIVRNQGLKDAFYEAINIHQTAMGFLKAQIEELKKKIESEPVKGEALGGY